MTNYRSFLSSNPMSAVEAFHAAIIEGNPKSIAEAHVSGDVTIIDSVAPFLWSGPNAVADWMSSMTRHVEERGIRDGCVVYDAPIAKLTDGDQAYAVVPVVWSYSENGIPKRDTANVAFALRRTSAGWRIAGWSWNPSN
jgi:hypothetical protein